MKRLELRDQPITIVARYGVGHAFGEVTRDFVGPQGEFAEHPLAGVRRSGVEQRSVLQRGSRTP